jgi:hypothetical protein
VFPSIVSPTAVMVTEAAEVTAGAGVAVVEARGLAAPDATVRLLATLDVVAAADTGELAAE